MIAMKIYYILALTGLLVLQSCYKDDYKVSFDPTDNRGLIHQQLVMGEDYATQLFLDLETQHIHQSKMADWDLAVATDDSIPYIKINTGKGWSAYRASFSHIDADTTLDLIHPLDWHIDNPDGDPAQCALGDFQQSPNLMDRVIILRKDLYNGSYAYFNCKVLSLTTTDCELQVRNLQTNTIFTRAFKIPQNIDQAFYYARVEDADITTADQSLEPSLDWDLNFTRYARYFADDKLNYIVTGVLLHPTGTEVYLDSTSNFEDIEKVNIDENKLSNNLEGIGYSWKSIDNSFEDYSINKHYNYIIKTKEGNYYKLRFLSFYNNLREKGCPTFEYKKL